MNRFLIFGFDGYEERGGVRDIIGWADDLDAAKELCGQHEVVEIEAVPERRVHRSRSVHTTSFVLDGEEYPERPEWIVYPARPACTQYRHRWGYFQILDLLVGQVHVARSDVESPTLSWETYPIKDYL